MFLIFCEFFNFAFNFAVPHHWATANLFLPQMVTLAGYVVFSGHLVVRYLIFPFFSYQNSIYNIKTINLIPGRPCIVLLF